MVGNITEADRQSCFEISTLMFMEMEEDNHCFRDVAFLKTMQCESYNCCIWGYSLGNGCLENEGDILCGNI